ncbi:MAG: SusC/RagA family TonB-linked outer membrane protein [Bacteroidales bacterium]|nr:SusC/RagA family TonB-linked outer membrane protein [Bacteroidales bacterium]
MKKFLITCERNLKEFFSRKKIRVIKILLFLCFFTVFQLFTTKTYSQLKKLSLDLENIKIADALREIESQSEFYFLYSPKLIDVDKAVTISAQQESITNILSNIFDNKVDFLVYDRQIVLSPKNELFDGKEIFQQVVSGKVTDRSGTPVVGASVVVPGTTIGTLTDNNGSFSLAVPQGATTLSISFVGMEVQTVPIGNRTVFDIVLETASIQMDEVVVTALGIKREVRTLGYSATDIKAEEISENRSSTALTTLQGKISGVNISTLTTGPVSSNKIRIRGQSSFSGTNTPLIVVNGMPIDNTSFKGGGGSVGNSDGGDGLASINMDDVESMTVLKGAAAAALYGSRAKDGVVMITTRTRGAGRGLGLEYNINFSTLTPLDFTDFQYEYGQGEGGIRPTAPNPTSGVWSFGEKFEPGMTQVLFDGVVVPYEPVYNRIRKFYEIGTNLTNTVTLSNNTERGGFNLSFSNNMVDNFVPNSDFKRNTINLGFDQNITEKLKVTGLINYSIEDNNNPPQVGGQEFSTATAVYTVANSMPWDLLKEKMLDENGDEFIYSRFLPRTNPYFSAYEHFENIDRDRLFGNIAIRYDINDWIYIQGRVAQDFYSRARNYNIPHGYAAIAPAPVGYIKGSYTEQSIRFRERNLDFLIGGNHKFGDYGIDVTFGGNQMYRRNEILNVTAQDFVVRDLYTIMNGRVKNPQYSLNERAVNSLYGSAEISFKNYLYINSTLRNDWFSTLAPDNRSILYPSVTTSFVFSDAFRSRMPDWVSFAKIRAAYAEVGDDNVDAYSHSLYYTVENNSYPSPSGDLVPVGRIDANTVPNSNLRPLRVSEMEFGLDLRLFQNRVSFDFAVYRKISKDQIISAQISNTSGYNNQLINIGQSMNQGFESLINFSPIRTNSFEWNFSANVTYNTSEVQKLGLSEADTMINIGSVRQIVGRPLGQIFVYMFQRDDQGRMIINKNSGFPMRSGLTNVGSNQPNWFGGITNTFTYKRITLSALIDFKLGRDYIINGGGNYNLWRHGLHKGTLPGRDVGYVIADGVYPDGTVNTTKAAVQPYYESIAGNRIDEPFIYKGGYWKLRQINLSYNFSGLLPSSFFIKDIKFSLVGSNILTIKKWTENMDPEELYSFTDNSDGRGWNSLPLTRTLGFNLNVKF